MRVFTGVIYGQICRINIACNALVNKRHGNLQQRTLPFHAAQQSCNVLGGLSMSGLWKKEKKEKQEKRRTLKSIVPYQKLRVLPE